MDTRLDRTASLLTGLGEAAYVRLLKEARDVSQRSVDRMRTLGEEYPETLPPDALTTLEQTTFPSHDRRHELRRRGCPARGEVWSPERSGARLPAFVIDSSPGGFGLLLPTPVAVGAVLELQTARLSEEKPVLVRVVHSEPQGTVWFVGCATLSG